jgi:hypothetical protein
MMKTLSFLLLLLSGPAFASHLTLDGTYQLAEGQHADNIRDCAQVLVLKLNTISDGSLTLEVTDDKGYFVSSISNNKRVQFYNDDIGGFGYFRDGGTVSARHAAEYNTAAGPSIATFLFPIVGRDGVKYKLGLFNSNKLIVKRSDTTYGIGSRQKCVYRREEQ